MDLEERKKIARSADGEDLWTAVRDAHPAVVMAAVMNRNLSEDMALSVARTHRAGAETLALLAGDVRFKDSYPLKVAICRNPKTPQKVTFSLMKFLKIFDLGDLSRDQRLPVGVRQRAEFALGEKIKALPSGIKTSLAKRASSAIILQLMDRGDREVIAAALQSPLLTEWHLCMIVNRKTSGPLLIRMIAEDRKWSLRYRIRYALIRNFLTPMERIISFLGSMTSADIRELYHDDEVPLSTKPYLFHELSVRKEDAAMPDEDMYDLADSVDATDHGGAGLGEG